MTLYWRCTYLHERTYAVESAKWFDHLISMCGQLLHLLSIIHIAHSTIRWLQIQE